MVLVCLPRCWTAMLGSRSRIWTAPIGWRKRMATSGPWCLQGICLTQPWRQVHGSSWPPAWELTDSNSEKLHIPLVTKLKKTEPLSIGLQVLIWSIHQKICNFNRGSSFASGPEPTCTWTFSIHHPPSSARQAWMAGCHTPESFQLCIELRSLLVLIGWGKTISAYQRLGLVLKSIWFGPDWNDFVHFVTYLCMLQRLAS